MNNTVSCTQSNEGEAKSSIYSAVLATFTEFCLLHHFGDYVHSIQNMKMNNLHFAFEIAHKYFFAFEKAKTEGQNLHKAIQISKELCYAFLTAELQTNHQL